MGILLIAAVLISILAILEHHYETDGLFIAFIVSIFIVALPMSLGIQGDYYPPQEVEIIKIGTLSNVDNNENNSRYLSRDKDGFITYLRLEKDDNTNSWKPETLKKDSVIAIIEKYGVKEPTLTIYESGYKGNFWTFSLGNTEKSYVFTLPSTEGFPIYERAY